MRIFFAPPLTPSQEPPLIGGLTPPPKPVCAHVCLQPIFSFNDLRVNHREQSRCLSLNVVVVVSH